MLDHVSLGVSDIERSRNFYDAALRPLGLVRIVDFGDGRGSDYGAAPGSTGVQFTITREVAAIVPSAGSHLCFRAPDRTAVRAFHSAALAAAPACAPIMRIIMGPSFLIPTVIALKPSVTRQTDQRPNAEDFRTQARGPAASMEEVEAGQ